MKSLFTKTAIAITLMASFTSTALYAHDNSCDVDLDASLTINKNTLEFFDKKDRTLYKIIDNKTLIIDGKLIDLNSKQQALVYDYSMSIRTLVPEVKDIALEGVDLALEGVGLVFDELLGEENEVGAELIEELSALKEEISTRFSMDHDFTIGADGLNGDEFLGDEFEDRIESAVEKAVMSSMGSLLVAVGQEMLFSNGDTDAFETRMENFGETIENEMEGRAEKIELKAEKLCLSIVEIDHLEEQLKATIDEMSAINVITIARNLHNEI